MDLLDFEGENLYFEEDLPVEVEEAIKQAGSLYGEGDAEPPLLSALELAPSSLTVLVALYRFYYYQHRLEAALGIADRALTITSRRLRLPLDWSELTPELIGRFDSSSVALLRFHLLSLKAKAYLLLRLARREESRAMLAKLVELDANNRLGARQLLEVADSAMADVA